MVWFFYSGLEDFSFNVGADVSAGVKKKQKKKEEEEERTPEEEEERERQKVSVGLLIT